MQRAHRKLGSSPAPTSRTRAARARCAGDAVRCCPKPLACSELPGQVGLRDDVAALHREVRVPARRAGRAAVALRPRKAWHAAGAAKGLVEPEFDGPDLSDGRHVDALLHLLPRRPHAVAPAVLAQDLEHSLLADEVALVDHKLADAAWANLHHVQAPAIARRQGPGPTRRGCGAAEGGWARQAPGGHCKPEAASGARHGRRTTRGHGWEPGGGLRRVGRPGERWA
mmetsp:Transcript_51522/g.164994  ORF Transcript_51522/g.164994 Transcript_51522/m.164994 type:complete len:226 (+) Transcript_51522:77-754(+)